MSSKEIINNSISSENGSENTHKNNQAKNKSILLLILFTIYAIAYAITWKYKLGVAPIDLSFVLLVVALYFRLARKKLAEGKIIKRYNHQTRKVALWVICIAIIFIIIPILAFVLGDLI